MCKGWKFQNRFFFVDVRAAENCGSDRIEFYIDFVQVLLSAFMLGYVVGKKKKEKDA